MDVYFPWFIYKITKSIDLRVFIRKNTKGLLRGFIRKKDFKITITYNLRVQKRSKKEEHHVKLKISR